MSFLSKIRLDSGAGEFGKEVCVVVVHTHKIRLNDQAFYLPRLKNYVAIQSLHYFLAVPDTMQFTEDVTHVHAFITLYILLYKELNLSLSRWNLRNNSFKVSPAKLWIGVNFNHLPLKSHSGLFSIIVSIPEVYSSWIMSSIFSDLCLLTEYVQGEPLQ